MKKWLILIGILAFVILNIVLAYLAFSPINSQTLSTIPAGKSGKDQVYYVNNTAYPLGSLYVRQDNRVFVFVGKLLNVYEKDNVVYIKIQLSKTSKDTITAQINLPNTKVELVDHPIDYLLSVFKQSHTQLTDNSHQIASTLSQYKNQNLVFFAPLPSTIIKPTNLDPTTTAYRKRPDIIALEKLQDKAISCNTQLLSNLQQKKYISLSCTPYFPEIHVNTGKWKPL